ncbi:MAG: tetratricopeptide repeat protein [Alphaproteobacteria bacterium]|jgi:predicted Zn-dependent protease|nr:tetratricopeptide repeat protein [Alphaproteobacteria bacterium]
MLFSALRRIGILSAGLAVALSAGTAFAQNRDTDLCTVGEGEAAIASCSEIIATGSGAEIAWAYFNRGRAYFKAKMYGSAVGDLSEALRLKPDDLEALENRARALMALEDYRHAIADFGRMIELQPASLAAFRGRCWARAASGRDLDDAWEDCNQALTLKPGDAAALDARCFVDLRRAAYPPAIADCTAAKDADPNLASALYLRGVAKHKSGDTIGGDADIDQARARDPDIVRTFLTYGVRP